MTKRVVTSLLLTVGITVATLAAQTVPPPPQDPPKSSDVTVTGCLIQGSGPTVFLLDNAKINPNDSSEKGVRYLVINTMEDVNLATHVNHELALSGTPGTSKPINDPNPPNEMTLPTLTAKSVVLVADRCSAGNR